MSQNHLMMQVQADVLGIPVLRPSMTETTSLGAAIVGKQSSIEYKCLKYDKEIKQFLQTNKLY